jgi:sugar fermentation stimulation protein A
LRRLRQSPWRFSRPLVAPDVKVLPFRAVPVSDLSMLFPTPLVRGRLVRRYKRFLADVVLDAGAQVTASCPNTGSMLGLAEPGSIVWLSDSESPTRKYRHTWEIVELDNGASPALVGINTGRPNHIVAEAIAEGLMPELAGYDRVRREVRYGEKSRVDFLLESDRQAPCYVEVKNVHLSRRPGLAEFPDCVTARGRRHLVELAAMVAAGARAMMVYLVQRDDAAAFSLARDIDPSYASTYRAARAAGVEAVAYGCRLTRENISLHGPIPIIEPQSDELP